MATPTPRSCPHCGTSLVGASAVDDLCSACLLTLGLADERHGAGATSVATPASPARPGATASRPGTLAPVGTGISAPAWAMPAELLRQAARRLRLAAIGVALFFAGSIILNNLVEGLGWHHFQNPALRNVVAAIMVAVSVGMAWLAHSGQLTPRRLLGFSLGYEVVVALAASTMDHLEPYIVTWPFATIPWLALWIVIFPLFVPASPRWALLAGLASASTWPLVYYIGLALGKQAVLTRIVALDSLENYIAAGLAMFSTIVIRRLQELGCYQLVQKLDHGGMGEIWRARHRMLARPVAVKLIRPDLIGLKSQGEAASLVGRFQREAEATAALHSAHTVELHDFGVTPEGTFYYVMELLDGLDLETLVRRFGPVPPERVIHLLVQACDSLAEAHAVGLVHRDVKPANIVACHWGLKWDFVKVLDFGLVKATWSMGDDDHLTSEGTITGTPAYIAPEAALGGRPLDSRVDLYGLGCVGYWLLTGERPFVGRTPVEVLMHHVRTPPIPPSERLGQPIPGDLEELILTCLAKEPDERPPSAEWLAERLVKCESALKWTPNDAREWWEANVRPGSSSSTEAATLTATPPSPRP